MSLTKIKYDAVFSLGSNSLANRKARKHFPQVSGYSPMDGCVTPGLEDAIAILMSGGELGMRLQNLKYLGKAEDGRTKVIDTATGVLFNGAWQTDDLEKGYHRVKLVWDRRLRRVLRVLCDPEAHPLFIWLASGYDNYAEIDQYYRPCLHRTYGYDISTAKAAIQCIRSNFPAQASLLYIDYDQGLPTPELRHMDSKLIACSHGHAMPQDSQEEFYDKLLQELEPVFSELLQPLEGLGERTRQIHELEKEDSVIAAKAVDWQDYLYIDSCTKVAYRETLPEKKYTVLHYVRNKFLTICPQDGSSSDLHFHRGENSALWQQTFRTVADLYPELAAVKKEEQKSDAPQEIHFTETPTKNVTVTSLWVGEILPEWAQLSIKSWITHGHHYRLYLYYDCDTVPEGVEIKDAREILPEEAIFYNYQYHNFSYWWRWIWLAKYGGIWVDTDLVCVNDEIPLQQTLPMLPDARLDTYMMYFPKSHMIPSILSQIGENPTWIAPWDTDMTARRKYKMMQGVNAEARRKAAPYGYADLQHHAGGLSKMPYEVQYWGKSVCGGEYADFPEQWYVEGKALGDVIKPETFALHLCGTQSANNKLIKEEMPSCVYTELLRKYLAP